MMGVPNTFESVLARVDRTGDCWIWTGSINNAGYGRVRVNSQLFYVHRFMYEHFVGPIPDGLFIDHLCRVRKCCRPEYLEPVTPKENMLRGKKAFEFTGVCMNGLHDLTQPDAIQITSAGLRLCRQCRRATLRRSYLRSRTTANN